MLKLAFFDQYLNMRGDVADLITNVKLHFNRFMGFGVLIHPILPFLCLACRLHNTTGWAKKVIPLVHILHCTRGITFWPTRNTVGLHCEFVISYSFPCVSRGCRNSALIASLKICAGSISFNSLPQCYRIV